MTPTGADSARLRQVAQSMADQKRFDQALDTLRGLGEALQDDAAGQALMGVVLLRMGRLAEAVPAFERALALDPAPPATHAELGQALARLGRNEEAVASFGRVIERAPRNIPARLQRAALWLDLDKADLALADLDDLLAQKPIGGLLATVQNYRCRALGALKRHGEALKAIDAALKIDPNNPQAHFQRGRQLLRLFRPDEAQTAFEQALAIDPAHDAARYLLSLAQLRRGDFAQGWKNYERRWKTDWFHGQSGQMITKALIPRLHLDNAPQDLAGKSVLVVSEQGIGDQIMFASIIPDLAVTAAKVTFVCEPRLTGLLKSSFPTVDSTPPHAGLRVADFDRITPLASLGYTFRKTADAFPGRPYLTPRLDVVSAWREHLGPRQAPMRIGISWRGGTDNTALTSRSLSLEQLRPLLERDDCEFVSLQYGDVEAELTAFNATLRRPIRAFPKAETEDFEQLAGLVLALDLVVSVQTAIIHLGGALGAPCLVMIPFVAEWRYGAEGETMPWYGSVKLLRQTKAGDWSSVIEAVGAQLDARAKA
jgi:tetratricopeptide (TPR) repeat protein